jgi:hypothetical protein
MAESRCVRALHEVQVDLRTSAEAASDRRIRWTAPPDTHACLDHSVDRDHIRMALDLFATM